MDWTVEREESGVKLIDFLRKRLPTLSARQIKRSIEQNGCRVNSRSERFASATLGRGDQVEFLEAVRETPEIHILYEDNAFLFIHKPSGIASDASELLVRPNIQLVHRLDKETSGVLLFAKSAEIFEKMVLLFKDKKVAKEYLSLVDGIPTKKQGTIENQLGKVASYQGQSLWGAVDKGLYARTDWQLEKAGREVALLRCFPITGRTHQIRVHLSSIGHPILGDSQYGRKFRSSIRPKRCLLHAEKLSFTHPSTGISLKVEANLPDDFIQAMREGGIV